MYSIVRSNFIRNLNKNMNTANPNFCYFPGIHGINIGDTGNVPGI